MSYALNTNPFLSLTALEVLLRTLAKSGSYWVDDPQDDRPDEERRQTSKVLNVERELIEEHFAQCRAFALEWSTKFKRPSNGSITHQMARIELAMWTTWTSMYRK